jgi:hypothetical protein
VFGNLSAHRLADFVIALAIKAIGGRKTLNIGHRLDVPRMTWFGIVGHEFEGDIKESLYSAGVSPLTEQN